MRKAFRVATIFTGVAAATAGFAPTAIAGPVGPVGPKISGRLDGTTVEACNNNTTQWVHMYYPKADHHGPECFGGVGTIPIRPGIRFAGLCAGNNYGSFYGVSALGSPVHRTFGSGSWLHMSSSYNHPIISKIVLKGHNHTIPTCPQTPIWS